MPEETILYLTIDGEQTSAAPGTTILKAAQAIGIEIPTLCVHDYCTANAVCRLCVVEVEGSRVLTPSCVAQVSGGMRVSTRSERVFRARRSILEMLLSSVDLSEAPDLLRLAQEYGADPLRYPLALRRQPEVIDDNPMYIRDYAKCVMCWRCVQVCAEDAQYAFALNFSGRGFDTQITTFFQQAMPATTCVFCGQCLGVCPTGALKPKRLWLLQQGYSPGEIMDMTRTERRRRRK